MKKEGGKYPIFFCNSLFYYYNQPIIYTEQESIIPLFSVLHQLTATGEPGTIYNGIADWLYEEEILGQSHTTYVTKDGSKLAYISFNDSQVEEHALHNVWNTLLYLPKSKASFLQIGKTRNEASELKFRYPKAGSTNPKARIFVKKLTKQGNGDVVQVVPPSEIANQ